MSSNASPPPALMLTLPMLSELPRLPVLFEHSRSATSWAVAARVSSAVQVSASPRWGRTGMRMPGQVRYSCSEEGLHQKSEGQMWNGSDLMPISDSFLDSQAGVGDLGRKRRCSGDTCIRFTDCLSGQQIHNSDSNISLF